MTDRQNDPFDFIKTRSLELTENLDYNQATPEMRANMRLKKRRNETIL